jgi:hypothetical protein
MAEAGSSGTTGDGGTGLGLVAAGAAVIAVAAIAIALGIWVLTAGGSATTTYLIEAGTGARLDRGEVVELMPTEVRLSVGDTLVIRNADDRAYVVGPYLVRAGETVEQTFQRAQTLVGECTLSGTGEIRIVVT